MAIDLADFASGGPWGLYWPGCCCETCTIAEDTFNRADSATPGTAWQVVSGTWEIVSNALSETSGAGLVFLKKTHPKNSPTGVVYVDLLGPANGTKHRVLVNYVDDENYLYAEYYHATNGADCYLAVGIVVAGDETELNRREGYSIGSASNRLVVCRSRDGLYAYLEGRYDAARACGIEDNGGRRVALAGGSIGFDNFDWEQHHTTNPDCPMCMCECEGYCLPSELLLTVVPVTCDCETMTGHEATGNGHLTVENWDFWLFEITLPNGADPICAPEEFTWQFGLQCPSGDPQWQIGGWILQNLDGYFPQLTGFEGWEPGGPFPYAYPYFQSCSPLLLKFGPFRLYYEQVDPPDPEANKECFYEIHVTKAPEE